MFKSIFSKYFTVMSLIIIVSFAAMGGMQMLLTSRYWVSDKRELLGENAKKIAQQTAKHTVQSTENDSDYIILPETLIPLIRERASASGSNVLLVSQGNTEDAGAGTVIFCSEDIDCAHEGRTVPASVFQAFKGNDYFSVGTLEGIYATRQYTAGTPIYVAGNASPVGYVFVSASASGMNETLRNNLQVFFLSALGVLTLTFIAIYAMTYRLVRPLRQMVTAVRSFAGGDFSARVPVSGKDEVAELATSLNNMAVSLSSTEGMHRSFVANVSHELKTPMTTIAGFIDGILDGTIPQEKREYYLKIVSDEVKRLSRLVKSMLDLSRIDSGALKLNPVRFDLTEVTCGVLVAFERRLEEKNITVTGLEDCGRADVNGDYDLIGQVVYNLLDNAIKFINPDGTLTLRTEKRDGRVYCSVRNTGVGISAQEMSRIFERFYKSDKSRSLDKNGVGLGLYIVKSVINLHHGEIYVRSVEGEYCEFTFWLPDADLPPMGSKGHDREKNRTDKGEKGDKNG